jgi:hypothetical protein
LVRIALAGESLPLRQNEQEGAVMASQVTRVALLAVWLLPGAASADELIFKNGDRLQGTVIDAVAGKLRFDSAVVGKVTASVAELESFTTEEAVEVHLQDGTVLSDRITRDAVGTMHFSTEPSRALDLEQIDGINPEPVAWHGSLTAGLDIDRGDTDEQDADVEFKARWVGERYRYDLRLLYDGDRSRSDGGDYETSDRLYRGRMQLDRLLTDRLFVYTRLRGERDGVADLDLRTSLGSGLGYKLFNRPGFSFEVQSGLAWTHEDYEDDSQDTDFPSGVLTWDLKKALRGGLHFFHDGEWSPSLREFNDIQLLTTDTGLRLDLARGWFTQAKVRWEIDTEPAAGKERDNVDYIFSLGWGF